MSGNSTAKVGHWSTDEIKALSTRFQLSKSVRNEDVPKAEDALAMISQSVRQVILDVKVGPLSFEKGLAEDVLSLLKKTNCKNCLVWAKSDDLGREMIKLSKDVVVHCSFFCILYSNDPSIICAYDHMSRTFQ